MNYKVEAIPPFNKQLKKLVKKYPSLKKEFLTLIESLEINPNQGTKLGMDCYKIRIAIASKNKGKSGGARVITNIKIENNVVYLLSIYDKSNQENISDFEIYSLLKFIET